MWPHVRKQRREKSVTYYVIVLSLLRGLAWTQDARPKRCDGALTGRGDGDGDGTGCLRHFNHLRIVRVADTHIEKKNRPALAFWADGRMRSLGARSLRGRGLSFPAEAPGQASTRGWLGMARDSWLGTAGVGWGPLGTPGDAGGRRGHGRGCVTSPVAVGLVPWLWVTYEATHRDRFGSRSPLFEMGGLYRASVLT
jgi:hypothetical protein